MLSTSCAELRTLRALGTTEPADHLCRIADVLPSHGYCCSAARDRATVASLSNVAIELSCRDTAIACASAP